MHWFGWLLLGILAATGLAILAYWQLVVAEGTYLGRPLVTWLYDRFAHKYDDVKDFSVQDDRDYLALPLLIARGGGRYDGLVLDVATGTGRLTQALVSLPQFSGQVIGLDTATLMLNRGRDKQLGQPLLVADAMRLPFADDAFPVVTCLEALEFFPDPGTGLREMIRVLQAGGLLITTQRIGWEAKLMPGKAWSNEKMESFLTAMGQHRVIISPWLNIYNQVWSLKPDPSALPVVEAPMFGISSD